MFLNIGVRSIITSLIMFFVVEVLNVYWQTIRLTIGDIDRAIKVSDEYSNLNTLPYILLIAGIILILLSIIFERKKA